MNLRPVLFRRSGEIDPQRVQALLALPERPNDLRRRLVAQRGTDVLPKRLEANRWAAAGLR
jgi:hypothetical protein